jgi:hypothetical protein
MKHFFPFSFSGRRARPLAALLLLAVLALLLPLGASAQVVVSTLAGGGGGVSGSADGTGRAARFNNPFSVALDGAGNVYVADGGNNRIRKVSPAGVVTTLAGSTYGYADGPGSTALFALPNSVALDGAGNVYVADFGDHNIRKVLVPAAVPTLTSVNPTSGVVGTSITLTGTGLTGTTGVSFNGTAATTFAVVNATTVTATVPTGATSGLVTVTTPGGTSNGVLFSTCSVPVLAGYTFQGNFGGKNYYKSNAATSWTQARANARAAGGELVAITSAAENAYVTTLTNGSSVWLGLTDAAVEGTFVWSSGEAVTYTNWKAGEPNNLGNEDYVFMYLVGGDWNDANNGDTDGGFYYPSIVEMAECTTPLATTLTGISPTSGLAGTVVTLTGTGLTGTTAVTFNGVNALGFTVNAAGTQITVTAPAGVTTGYVAVTTPTGGASSPVPFVVYTCATVAGTLACGQTVSGTTVGGSLFTEPDFGCNASTGMASSPGVLYSFVASSTGSYEVNTCAGSSFDTQLFVFTGACGARTCVDSNDDACNVGSSVNFNAVAGTTYYVYVNGYSSEQGSYTLTLSCPVPNLVISTPGQTITGHYNNITITGPTTGGAGTGTLAGAVQVDGALLVQDGGTLNTNCQALTGAGSFTLAAGGTLGICSPAGITTSGATGAVQVTGARSFSPDASYVYNGTSDQVTGAGLPAQVRNLSTTNPNSVALSAPTSVAQVLTVGAAGNLATNGQMLTLLSSAAGTALVVNSGTGAVTGAVTVQRYIAPVSNSTVADLATSGFAPEISQASVYNASTTPSLVTPFPTVYAYDQSRVLNNSTYTPFDRGFVVPASLSTPLAVGRGYAVNIAGTQLVDFVGTLNNGNIALTNLARLPNGLPNAGEAGWNLVGNPYPAPIDWNLISAFDRSGLDAAMYVFESTGPYTGSYRANVNGVGGNANSGAGLIASGQGFFVRVSAGQTSGILAFRNGQRVTTFATQAPFRRTAVDARPLVQLELRGATGPADAFYAYAQAGATPGADAEYDAVKLPNPTGLNLSSAATSGEALAIDGRPAFTAATVLPLSVGMPAAGAYTFTAAALNNLPAGLDAYLRDALTGQVVNLRNQPSYSFSVSTAQATALLTGRFTLQFAAASSPLATAPALTAAEVTLFPNPAHAQFSVLVPAVAGATRVQATLLNALGQVVRRQSAASSAQGTRLEFETGNLAAGVYTLRLQAGATTLAKRVVIQ